MKTDDFAYVDGECLLESVDDSIRIEVVKGFNCHCQVFWFEAHDTLINQLIF